MATTRKLTRTQARAAFRKAYGAQTFSLVKMISEGYSSAFIAKRMKVSARVVATTRGNFSRGVYSHYTSKCGFTKRFTDTTRDVVSALKSGFSPRAIVEATGFSQQQVAAITRHWKNGSYGNFAM